MCQPFKLPETIEIVHMLVEIEYVFFLGGYSMPQPLVTQTLNLIHLLSE